MERALNGMPFQVGQWAIEAKVDCIRACFLGQISASDTLMTEHSTECYCVQTLM